MARKTVNVKDLKEFANMQLASNDEWASDPANLGFKSGICAMIEKALHLSGNYNGFYFLNNEDSKINTIGYFSRKYF